MTMQELYNIKYIKREIAMYEEKITELREIAENITPKYSDMPHGSGVNDKIGNAVTAIVFYTELLEKAVQEKLDQEIIINQYILNCPDAQTRNIMYLRFIAGKTWIEISMRIGGGNTADGVRKKCKRYVESN